MFGADLVKKATGIPGDAPFRLSANLGRLKKPIRPIVDPYVIIEAAGKRCCIIAMSDVGIIMQAADKNVAGSRHYYRMMKYSKNITPAVLQGTFQTL